MVLIQIINDKTNYGDDRKSIIKKTIDPGQIAMNRLRHKLYLNKVRVSEPMQNKYSAWVTLN